MNMFDEASALKGTMNLCSLSQSEMAKKLGVSQSYVANKLRLLRFDERARERILAAGLTERHARALLRLEGRGELEVALDKIIREKLNVQRSEALVDFLHDGDAPQRICEAEKYKKTVVFKDTVDHLVQNLVSAGIEAQRHISYYGKKTYITISIEET